MAGTVLYIFVFIVFQNVTLLPSAKSTLVRHWLSVKSCWRQSPHAFENETCFALMWPRAALRCCIPISRVCIG